MTLEEMQATLFIIGLHDIRRERFRKHLLLSGFFDHWRKEYPKA